MLVTFAAASGACSDTSSDSSSILSSCSDSNLGSTDDEEEDAVLGDMTAECDEQQSSSCEDFEPLLLLEILMISYLLLLRSLSTIRNGDSVLAHKQQFKTFRVGKDLFLLFP